MIDTTLTYALQLPDPYQRVAEQRKKLNDKLRSEGYYATAPSPGNCYIFDVVLGIDPRIIPVQVIEPECKTYRVFVYDKDGNKLVKNGKTVQVTRKFTKQQREALKEWYPLFSPTVRGMLL